MKKGQRLLQLIVLLFITLIPRAVFGQSATAAGYTFTATSKTFNYVSGGTPVTTIQVDDDYTTIPIGFTFTFCGVDYSDVTVCSNGWLRFGTGVGTSVANWNYNDQVNSGIQPCVYALYEDVSGAAGTSAYLVTGSAPNRVFTWECRNWLWDYAATTPCVSFQVKLYETTGIIECLYKQESGSVAVNTSGGATIGIAKSGTDWQSLNNVTSSPVSSSTSYTYSLSATPASGQSYQWDPGPPCAAPSSLAVTNVNSKGASFSWAAIAGTSGYEYAVDQNSAAPTTGLAATINTATVGGLAAATTYYLHVRNKCSATNISKWTNLSFQTLPECSFPVNPAASNIDSNSADVSWGSSSTATNYDYIIDTDPTNPPTNSSPILNTTLNGKHLTGLISGTTYYLHVRSLCPGSDSSEWVTTQFYVPIHCRRPNVEISDLKSDKAILYWNGVSTAKQYEFALETSATPVSLGTPTPYTYIQGSFLKSNTTYYFHVRSLCEDHGVKTISAWTVKDFTTLPATGIDDISAQRFIDIYPNPASDVMNIRLKNYTAGAVLSLTDMTGRKVKEQTVTDAAFQMDLHGIVPGIYQLRYTDNSGTQSISISKL